MGFKKTTTTTTLTAAPLILPVDTVGHPVTQHTGCQATAVHPTHEARAHGRPEVGGLGWWTEVTVTMVKI